MIYDFFFFIECGVVFEVWDLCVIINMVIEGLLSSSRFWPFKILLSNSINSLYPFQVMLEDLI
jgi:hypothetical protein